MREKLFKWLINLNHQFPREKRKFLRVRPQGNKLNLSSVRRREERNRSPLERSPTGSSGGAATSNTNKEQFVPIKEGERERKAAGNCLAFLSFKEEEEEEEEDFSRLMKLEKA